MIKFFRKIRQNLLSEGKTGKYLKYAIGEIALVVIGILIALQLNNWNGNRIQQKKESKFIEQIHNEFILNRTQLDLVSSYHFRAYNSSKKIVSMMPIDLNKIDLDSLSYFIEETFYTWTFNPQQSSINSLSSTSSFDIISNLELRTQLQNWNDLVLDYMEDETTSKNFTLNYYYPYLREKIAFTNYKSNVGVLYHPKIDLSFLTDLKFENLIHARMDVLKDIVNPDEANELNDVSASIDKIAELTTIKENK
jgi:hypothetical protein